MVVVYRCRCAQATLRELEATRHYCRTCELVVDLDLVDAVKRHVIAGAVLDVFRVEPLPDDHPFWTTPGITVLPHFGGLHPTRDEQVAALFVDNLRRFLDGEPLRHVVDRARGY